MDAARMDLAFVAQWSLPARLTTVKREGEKREKISKILENHEIKKGERK